MDLLKPKENSKAIIKPIPVMQKEISENDVRIFLEFSFFPPKFLTRCRSSSDRESVLAVSVKCTREL